MKITEPMDDKEAVKKIIDDFFANATEADILELRSLLEKQGQNRIMPGKMEVHNAANKFASDLKNRMGLTSEQITRSARDAVRTMILQYDPYIPEEQIQSLLDQWVPDKQKNWKRVPPDAVRTMVSQFAAYGRGELTEAELNNFPKGWAKKYWEFFPEELQRLIRAYIKDQITRTVFWQGVEEFLRKG